MQLISRWTCAAALGAMGMALAPGAALAADASSETDVIAAFDDPTSVGGTLTLTADVTVTQGLTLDSGSTLVIDLGGHELAITGTPGVDGAAAGADGGHGGDALTNNGTLVVSNGTLSLAGGGGGNGADGSDGQDGASADETGDGTAVDGQDGEDGQDGGNGGNGGDAIVNNGTILEYQTHETLLRGARGNGGAGGAGGVGGAASDAGGSDGIPGAAGTDGAPGTNGDFRAGSYANSLVFDATVSRPDMAVAYADTIGDATDALALLSPTWPTRAGYELTGWSRTDGSPVQTTDPATGTVRATWTPVSDPGCLAADFAAQFNTATGAVTLCGDVTISAADPALRVRDGQSVTLDLAGHTLTATEGSGGTGNAGIGVPAGTSLTISDSVGTGSVNATGDSGAAGIGGGSNESSGSITITGGTITANGGYYGSGIGGGSGSMDGSGNADSGPISITGGIVNAYGWRYAAGIGGGSYGGSASTISITGGTVTAKSGADGEDSYIAAAIGGGSGGDGGTITIGGESGSAAHVTATGGPEANAVGPGAGGNDGSITVNTTGTLTLNSVTTFAENGSVGNDGIISVASGTTLSNRGIITGSGTLGGAGTVENLGTIAHSVTVDLYGGLTVTDNNFIVGLNNNYGGSTTIIASFGPVYAPTLADAGLGMDDFQPSPTRPGYDFTAWYLDAAATGTSFDPSTPLPGTSADGFPAEVNLFAGWETHTGVDLYAYPGGAAVDPVDCPVAATLAEACSLTSALVLANDADTVILAANPGASAPVTGANTPAVFTTTTGWDIEQSSLTIQPDEAVSATLDGQDQAPSLLRFDGTGTLTVADITVTGTHARPNAAAVGGGITLQGSGTLHVSGSTFSHNVTSGDATGMTIGGGIVNWGGAAITVTNSTFVDNVTAHMAGGTTIGGGIVNGGGDATVIASTIVGNTSSDAPSFPASGGLVAIVSGPITLSGTLLADNGPNCVIVESSPGETTVTDSGYNIADDDSCRFTAINSVKDAAELAESLTALADNGGFTPTMLPQPDSPARGMIPATTAVSINGSQVQLCPTTDQRGVASTPGEPCTAGATQITNADVCTAAGLAAAFSGAADGDTVQLCGDVTVAAADAGLQVPDGAAITVDLAGHTLTAVGAVGLAGIGVPAGTGLTITDSIGGGTLQTTGGEGGAGIGGNDGSPGQSGDAGTITIDGGTITAQGGFYAAGIGGGGFGGTGGTIVINAGTITAAGGTHEGGAGIGGGEDGPAGTITLNGGTVVATGGDDGAAIGSGDNGGGGTIVIGTGSGAPVHVTVLKGPDQAFALGGETTFGSITINPTATVTIAAPLTIASSGTFVNDGSVTIADIVTTEAGAVIAGSGTMTGNFSGGSIGSGMITNHGAIAHTMTVDPDLPVTVRHYALTFDAHGGVASWGAPNAWGRVYGPSLAAVGLNVDALPSATRDGFTFEGWYLDAAAESTPITDYSPLAGVSTTGAAVPVTLYAGWVANAAEPTDPSDPTVPTDPRQPDPAPSSDDDPQYPPAPEEAPHPPEPFGQQPLKPSVEVDRSQVVGMPAEATERTTSVSLATTGLPTVPLVLSGGMLLLVGVGLSRVSRRSSDRGSAAS